MKKPNRKPQDSIQELPNQTFVIKDLYLFHPTKQSRPSRNRLWGIFDKTEGDIIYLESSKLDLRHFTIWHSLPKEYCYWCRATRWELRDYMYNLGHCDSRQHRLGLHHPS